jgi:hypothetical protein
MWISKGVQVSARFFVVTFWCVLFFFGNFYLMGLQKYLLMFLTFFVWDVLSNLLVVLDLLATLELCENIKTPLVPAF